MCVIGRANFLLNCMPGPTQVVLLGRLLFKLSLIFLSDLFLFKNVD